ncbi:MAG: alpha/beta fold hydrolase [Rhodospirillaceae bacterium]|nr:alpha/beta fold hydrolase [Rhodospirillaceae bacterium]
MSGETQTNERERQIYKYDRTPYLVIFDEKAKFKDTYGGQIDRIALEAQHLMPRGRPSKTVMIITHPIGGGQYLPMPATLAKQGIHTIYLNTRYRGADYALIMEKTIVDLGACIKDAKTRLGYERVVLGGWSGGGSMSLFYQSQAESPTVTQTPAGDAPDITQAGLIPADGVILLAAHMSRNRTLTEWLDASILDENDPTKRDPELDLYNPANVNQPPYTPAFLEKYRAAQIARNRRITAWVKDKLATLKQSGRENDEFNFVVHGTMADPRWLDPAVDPSDRKPRWCMLGDPQVVNMSPIGLGRFSSLRSWLSQWSYDDSNADGLKCAARLKAPLLSITNSADDAVTPSHSKLMYAAVPHNRKEAVTITGANHYYFGQPEKATEAARICFDWLKRNSFEQ